MSRTVLAWVVERVDAGERVAMASVISASGSVPGKPGARLAVSSDGTKFGTVGGAGLEMMVENALRDLLKVSASETRKIGGRVETFILHKDGKGKEAVALDSLCGGRVTVAMEVVEPVPHILISGGGHVGRGRERERDQQWSCTRALFLCVIDARDERRKRETSESARRDAFVCCVRDVRACERAGEKTVRDDK